MSAAEVEAVRRFNRAYTERLGVLDEKILGSAFSLTAVRVMFELAHRERATAAEVAKDLRLDPGYVSRLVASLQASGLLRKEPEPTDRRQRILALTAKGRRTFAALDRRQDAEVETLLDAFEPDERQRFVAALAGCARVLDPEPTKRATRLSSYVLREPRPGDLGWVVERHGAVYASEYGWDARFEGLVATIVGEFTARARRGRDRCWIADRDGERLGSVFVVGSDKPRVAKLRLLLVEPSARGLGLGTRLVDECIGFATRAGYRSLELWTNDVLVDARRIYERAGFTLVAEERHARFGPRLVGQTFALTLGGRARRTMIGVRRGE